MNPLKQERVSRNLTIDQVASQSGISRIAVIRNEQGCYVDPSPTLCNFYGYDGTFLTTLLQAYRNFQQHQRTLNFGQLSETYLKTATLVESFPTSNPITQWREVSNLSKAKVSTLFCIHPDILPRLELRSHLVPHEFPKQFMQALIESGYEEIQLVVLQSKYQVWRKQASSKVNSV